MADKSDFVGGKCGVDVYAIYTKCHESERLNKQYLWCYNVNSFKTTKKLKFRKR